MINEPDQHLDKEERNVKMLKRIDSHSQHARTHLNILAGRKVINESDQYDQRT